MLQSPSAVTDRKRLVLAEPRLVEAAVSILAVATGPSFPGSHDDAETARRMAAAA